VAFSPPPIAITDDSDVVGNFGSGLGTLHKLNSSILSDIKQIMTHHQKPPATSYTTGSRQVTLVDKDDQVTGEQDIFAAHHYPVARHRAVSVWLVWQGQLLLQQRSAQKPIGTNWWGNAICGNLKPGESYLECARRRLQEEIGLDQSNQPPLTTLYNFEYQAYGNETYGEHELDRVLAGEFSSNPAISTPLEETVPNITPNPSEVSQTLWIPITEFLNWANQTKYISAANTLDLEKNELKKATPALVFPYQNQRLTITPWSIIMARDHQLQTWLQALATPATPT
jgi:isopentenyl-diphosphate Delta-isomerase